MDIIIKPDVVLNIDKFLERISSGEVFIYPTDTIYGLGCDATNQDAVERIREIKKRQDKPFSIIAPNKDWILKNCYSDEGVLAWMEKLPGPYTLIMRLKNKNCIVPGVNNDKDTIGVRIPNHWISHVINLLNRPIVTTSANIVNRDFMTSFENLDIDVMKQTDFIIYEGEKRGRPSVIVNLEEEREMIYAR